MKLRKRFRPQKLILVMTLCAGAALVFPILKSNLPRMKPALQRAGERLALVSAFSDLPDRSRALLFKRFNNEVSHEDEPDAAPPENPEPAPSSSEGEDPGAPSEPPADPPDAAPSSSAPDALEAPKPPPPEIPAQYRGPMLEEDLSGYDGGQHLKLSPAGYLRNYTELSFDEIREVLSAPSKLALPSADAPQALIYHTHATEAFERYDSETYDTRNNWRSTDNNMNMVAVGDALAKSLTENGVNVIHDTTQHDYPSYNGSYERSAVTIAQYLEKYPSIRILLDVHRDAIDREGTLVRPVAEIGGKKAAQLMIIAGCDDGTMGIPEWRESLRFAAAVQTRAERDFPSLMRPIFFCYRKYNFDKSPASLLLEFGSHGNTLEECVYTAQLAGKSIAEAIQSYGS